MVNKHGFCPPGAYSPLGEEDIGQVNTWMNIYLITNGEQEVQKRLMEAEVGTELRLGGQGRPLRRWLQLPSEE